MTSPRPGSDDVARAHAAARNAGPPGSAGEPPRPTAGDHWRRFVVRWGWRAYALPILVVVTIAALIHGGGSANGSDVPSAGGTPPHAVAPPQPGASTVIKRDTGDGTQNDTALEAAALPAGGAYDKSGDGTFRVLKGASKVVGTTGRLWRYSIDVENGLTGIDLTQFQDLVVKILSDKRSWSGHGVRLQRVDSGPIDFHVTLTTSLTVRKYCGYTIHAESSCYAAAGSVPGVDLPANRVFFNDARWVRGAAAYIGDLNQYRIYMINHEDGHALGHEHAHQCLPNGMAPAMMQQSFGLRSTATGKFCSANPWPYPPGVSGAPGAEQPDTAANNEYGKGD